MSDETFYIDGTTFVPVPMWILDTLGAPQLRLYALLLSYGTPGQHTAWPSQETLGARLGASVRTVRDLLKQLEEAGVLKIEHRFSLTEGPRTNLYTLAWREPFGATRVLAEETMVDVPPAGPLEVSPHAKFNTNDQMEGLLNQLYNVDPKWQTLSTNPTENKAGYAALRKIINAYGQAIVTTALGRAWESRLHVHQETAYPLLVAICKSVSTDPDVEPV